MGGPTKIFHINFSSYVLVRERRGRGQSRKYFLQHIELGFLDSYFFFEFNNLYYNIIIFK